jgi:hypothetical protein
MTGDPTECASHFLHLRTETDHVSETLCFLVIYNSGRWTKSIKPGIPTEYVHCNVDLVKQKGRRGVEEREKERRRKTIQRRGETLNDAPSCSVASDHTIMMT